MGDAFQYTIMEGEQRIYTRKFFGENRFVHDFLSYIGYLVTVLDQIFELSVYVFLDYYARFSLFTV